jgi:hypothetical protein
MSKLRSISTAFWSDPLIEDLSPKEKLLFIYLITNDKTNMLGIYESSIKKISFETGLSITETETVLKRLEGLGRIKYIGNWVFVVNYMKHQNYNPNMMISALNTYLKLPKSLNLKHIEYEKDNLSEAFERLLKALGTVPKYELELELEYNKEDMSDSKNNSEPDIPKFNYPDLFKKYIDYYNKAFSKGFTVKGWHDRAFAKFKKLHATYKEDFGRNLVLVCENIKKDDFHVETNFKHITPEFIMRLDKFEKFLNAKPQVQKWNKPSEIFMCADWIKRIPQPPKVDTPEYYRFIEEWKISDLKSYQVNKTGSYTNLDEYGK